MPDFGCECSNKRNVVSPCRGCSECGWADWWNTGADGCKVYSQKKLDQRQKVIQKVVRVDSSQYAMNKAAMAVYQRKPRTAFGLRFGSMYNYPSTLSDRREPHIVPATQAVNRHTSSKHGSKTACRPGSTSAAGAGVDVKHGSYARYLARKKGISLKAGTGAYENQNRRSPTYDEILENPSLTKGGKNVKFSIVSGGGDCECQPNCIAFKNDDPNQASTINNFNVSVCDDTWDDFLYDLLTLVEFFLTIYFASVCTSIPPICPSTFTTSPAWANNITLIRAFATEVRHRIYIFINYLKLNKYIYIR